MQNQILCSRYQNPRDETATELTCKRKIPQIKVNLMNSGVNQNLEFESPNSGTKHHASLEQHEQDITPLQQLNPHCFAKFISFELQIRYFEVGGRRSVSWNKIEFNRERTEKTKLANCNQTLNSTMKSRD